MSFIYHIVPKNMAGEILFPLSDLKDRSPSTYAREVKKYDDHPQRKELPKRLLKKIYCLQEEVIHFSPIHPHLIFNGLKSVFADWNSSSLFYEIPIDRIRDLPAVLFDMNKTGSYVFGVDEPDEMFEFVTSETYKILSSLPVEALEFYNEWKARGKNGAPAMARIPHLMVKGRVSVANCKIIDWKNPSGIEGRRLF